MQAMQQQMMMQAAQREATKPLLEIRAGVLHQLAPPRKTVNADPRRGKIVVRYDEEGMLRFQWVLRPSDSIELNLMLTPSCATFTRVTECKDGRVYIMKMQGGGAKRFFWIQEPKEEKDEELIKKLLELINNPPPPPPSPMEQMMASMTDEERAAAMAQMGGMGGDGHSHGGASGRTGARAAAGTPSRRPGGAAGTPASRQDIAASLTNLAQQLINRGAGSADQGGDDEGDAGSHRVLSLGDVLDAERVVAQLDDSMIENLVQHLPAGQRTRADLIASLRSPQMQQTVQRMGQMLNSEHFGLVMTSLALPITGDLGVSAFVDAIQRQSDNERKSSGTSAAAPSASSSAPATGSAAAPSSSTTPSTPAKKTEEPKKS